MIFAYRREGHKIIVEKAKPLANIELSFKLINNRQRQISQLLILDLITSRISNEDDALVINQNVLIRKDLIMINKIKKIMTRFRKHDYQLSKEVYIPANGVNIPIHTCTKCGNKMYLDIWQMQSLPSTMKYNCKGEW